MKARDVVWVLRRGRTWEQGLVECVGDVLLGVRLDDGQLDHYRVDTLDAMQSLRAATEAVAKARDAVVEAARAWMDRDQEECDVDNAVRRLDEAERAEAEARASLEALR